MKDLVDHEADLSVLKEELEDAEYDADTSSDSDDSGGEPVQIGPSYETYGSEPEDDDPLPTFTFTFDEENATLPDSNSQENRRSIDPRFIERPSAPNPCSSANYNRNVLPNFSSDEESTPSCANHKNSESRSELAHQRSPQFFVDRSCTPSPCDQELFSLPDDCRPALSFCNKKQTTTPTDHDTYKFSPGHHYEHCSIEQTAQRARDETNTPPQESQTASQLTFRKTRTRASPLQENFKTFFEHQRKVSLASMMRQHANPSTQDSNMAFRPRDQRDQRCPQVNFANERSATTMMLTHTTPQRQNIDTPNMAKKRKSFWKKVEEFFKGKKKDEVMSQGGGMEKKWKKKTISPPRRPLTERERFPLRTPPPRPGVPRYFNQGEYQIRLPPVLTPATSSPTSPAQSINQGELRSPELPVRSLSQTQRVSRCGSFPPAGTVTEYSIPEFESDSEFIRQNRAYARQSLIQHHRMRCGLPPDSRAPTPSKY